MSKRFKSQDYFRYPRLGKKWRRPKGLQSKLRLRKGGSGMHTAVGYGSPYMQQPAVIANVKDFEKDCTKGVLISSGVGSKKALILTAKAKELGIAVLNMRRVKRATRLEKDLKARRELTEKSKKDALKKAEEKKAAKTEKKMGFHESVVPQVSAGKTKTYHLRDHDLKAGDKVAFESSQAGEVFGHGKITNVERMPVGKINLSDAAHHKTYDNVEQLIEAFKRHHPEKDVTPETQAFIYTYDFTPVKKEKEEKK